MAESLINVSNLFTNDYLPAKLTRRDPRMVERKKTGMAKARKRVSLNNYFDFKLFSLLDSTLGSNVDQKRVRNFIGFLPYIMYQSVHVELKKINNQELKCKLDQDQEFLRRSYFYDV